MNKKLIYIIIGFLPFSQVMAVDTQQLTQKSRAAIKMLGGELKATLQTSMKANGPVQSITICKSDAPLIASKVSKEKGMSVERTSLKYRNPENKPDTWETSVLAQFEQRKANGEAIKTLEYSELTEPEFSKHGGEKVFRYMKAIPTAEVCLKCHGSNIAPPIANKINKLYPDDKATGFNKGDIRGAFTVIQTIK